MDRGTRVHCELFIGNRISADPEPTLFNSLEVYGLLNRDFWRSPYLPISAITIAQMAEPDEYEAAADRIGMLYIKLKADLAQSRMIILAVIDRYRLLILYTHLFPDIKNTAFRFRNPDAFEFDYDLIQGSVQNPGQLTESGDRP